MHHLEFGYKLIWLVGILFSYDRRIFIVHLGVPCSWYTQDYFLQMSKMSKMNKWAMSKQFYSFKKMSKHFYYKMSKMSKWADAHMSKFGVKWAPEIQIYYKNTLECTMLMVHPGVPWVNSYDSPSPNEQKLSLWCQNLQDCDLGIAYKCTWLAY